MSSSIPTAFEAGWRSWTCFPKGVFASIRISSWSLTGYVPTRSTWRAAMPHLTPIAIREVQRDGRLTLVLGDFVSPRGFPRHQPRHGLVVRGGPGHAGRFQEGGLACVAATGSRSCTCDCGSDPPGCPLRRDGALARASGSRGPYLDGNRWLSYVPPLPPPPAWPAGGTGGACGRAG